MSSNSAPSSGPGGDLIGRLVQRPADPMAREVADQRIAPRPGKAADGVADGLQGPARRDLRHANLHRPPSVAAKALQLRPHWPKAKAGAGIRKEARFACRDVNVHQIAPAQDPVTRDAMGDLFVDADAGGAGEIVARLGRRDRALAVQHGPAKRIQLARGHAGLHGLAHRLQRVGHDPADGHQPVELFLLGDGHRALRFLAF